VPRASNSVKTKKIFLVPKSQENFFDELAPLGPSLDPIRSPEDGVDTRSARPSAATTSYFGHRALARREERFNMLTEERYETLVWLWENETNDEETQEWRDELNDEEQKLVDKWDNRFDTGLARMFQDMK